MKRNDPTWNPWHGCHKLSEGCNNCFMYYLDEQRGQDGSRISKNKTDWNLPLKKDRHGNFKIKSGEFIRVCMASDFFLEDADEWRDEAWDIMRKRPDVTFSILTKRAHRIKECLPSDWRDGWDNITFAVSCENQKRADERIPYLLELPAKHIWVSLKPFIGEMDLDKYLKEGKIETVYVVEKTMQIETKDSPLVEQSEPINSLELYNLFCNDFDNALKMYEDKRFEVTGIATKVGPDIHNKPSIEISNEVGGRCHVLCVFPSDEVYNKVSVGDKIVCRGNYLVMSNWYGIVMKKCEIVIE